MKIVSRLIVTVIVLGILAAAGIGIYAYVAQGDLVKNVVTQATGNEEIGQIAGKVMSGEDLDDAEIQGALGVDDETYDQIKGIAGSAGIDINDGEQMRDIAMSNMDKKDEVEEIVSEMQSGEISQDEAIAQLKGIVNIP